MVRPGDRIRLEGDNQKQADFLAACLAKADPKVLGLLARSAGPKFWAWCARLAIIRSCPQTLLLLLDSGGVRLQEANAGELAVAELMRAIVQARCTGVAAIALVGGKSGAFGGAGLTAATCSGIVISEQGRINVSGPEVIETNKGVEEFDALNKALVWSTDGGKKPTADWWR